MARAQTNTQKNTKIRTTPRRNRHPEKTFLCVFRIKDNIFRLSLSLDYISFPMRHVRKQIVLIFIALKVLKVPIE